jgi:ribose transport system permease protein
MELSAPNSFFRKTVLPIIITIAAIAIIAIIFNQFVGGKFLVSGNLKALFIFAVITSFVGWAFCFLFALGYMDLSVGAVIAVSVILSGEVGMALHSSLGVLLGGVVTAVVCMVINFNVFAWTRVPSWIAGLGMCLIYESFTLIYAKVKTAAGGYTTVLADEYSAFGRSPGVYIVFAVGIVGVYLLYNYSALGLRVRAIGSNPNVAKAMGINIQKTLILTSVVCGILIGCSGMIRDSYIHRLDAATNLTSLGYIFAPMATVFLAQVLSKWINQIIAVPLCAFIIYTVYNMMAMVGVPSGTLQETVLGIFIVVFGAISQRGFKGIVK